MAIYGISIGESKIGERLLRWELKLSEIIAVRDPGRFKGNLPADIRYNFRVPQVQF
jgi:hypothetical protein